MHHSYVAEARPRRRSDRRHVASHTATAARTSAGGVTRRLAASAKVEPPPLDWELTSGPWYDNNLAILELRPAGLRMWWTGGEVVDGQHDRPVLRRVATVEPIG